jgi:PadR family transcriptional regulator, regulatory protein PadR
MRGELLKGNLDLLLLAIVAGGPMHGYGIIEALRERSEGTFVLPEGTVYPALHRLEEAGLLASRWSDTSGRRRREYEISGAGREALRARAEEWRTFSGALEAVIGRAPWTKLA